MCGAHRVASKPNRVAATSTPQRSVDRCASAPPSTAPRLVSCSIICFATASRARSPRIGPGYLAYVPGRRPVHRGARGLHRRTQPIGSRASGSPRPCWCSSNRTRLTGCATGWVFRTDGSRSCSRPAARWRHSTPSCARVSATPWRRHPRRRAAHVGSGAPFGAEVGEDGRHHARPRPGDFLATIASVSDVAALRRQRSPRIAGRNGFAPFAVVATAGTTNTGAVDPLDAVADLCAARGTVVSR